jgi:hypothetical protein
MAKISAKKSYGKLDLSASFDPALGNLNFKLEVYFTRKLDSAPPHCKEQKQISLSLSLRKERGAAVLANHVANLPKVLKLARFKIRTANSLTLEPQVLQFGRTLGAMFLRRHTETAERATAGIRPVGIN